MRAHSFHNPTWFGRRPKHSFTGTTQRGVTLVELMIALVIGLVITLAAMVALSVSRRGFTTVDAASQMRDNGRFATDLIQRVALQTGFKDSAFVAVAPTPQELADDAAGLIPANVTGFNNGTFDTSNVATSLTTRTARTSSDGSDVLILRYQSMARNSAAPAASAPTDGTIVDCSGAAVTRLTDRYRPAVSIFYVAPDADGEPTLMCTSKDEPGNATNTTYTTIPLVRGVENFQVLYGIDGFTSANSSFLPFSSTAIDSVPERYVRADEIIVGGSTTSQATYNNWRHVRSIRIGLVLRAAPGSQQEVVTQTLYPFGLAKNSSTGTAGGALSSSNDTGTVYSAPADGRLRQTYTFTVHLRNDQSL